MTTYYSTGTASVSNGGTTVTGSGTAWASVVQAGDLFLVPAQGLVAMITAVASNTSITIDAWPGTTISGAAYKIVFASDAIRQSERARQLLEQLSAIDANGRGLFYGFSTTTTDADPGAGVLRLNNATIASATAAYLDNLDANGATVSTILDTWDDTGSSAGRGQLWVRQIADPSIFHAWNVTGSVVDGTGYRKLTLSYIGGSGAFADADEIMVQFLPVGAGEAGTDGTDGGLILTYDNGTSGDPGAGKFRLNNATHSSATALLIDNTDGSAATISGLVDTWDDSTATVKGTVRIVSQADASIWRVYSVTGSVVDSTGYRTVTVTYVAGNGTLGDETACSVFFARTGDNGAAGTNGTNGVDGTGVFSRVRAVAASNITIATALNDGDSLDGVTLATNDLVLVTGQTAPAENGVYVVGVSPARDSSFDTYDEHPGVYVSVMEGTTYADTLWRCTSNKGGTLDTTAITWGQFTGGTSVPFTAASSSGPAQLDLAEDTDNGTNKVSIKAPSAITSDRSFTLPDADVTISSFLATVLDDTNGVGVMTTLGLKKDENTVLDDTARTIAISGATNKFCVLIIPNGTAGGCGLVWANASGSPSVEILFQVGSTIEVVAGSGTLAGTTGTDGKLNVRTDGSGNFYIENRTAATRGYTLYIFS